MLKRSLVIAAGAAVGVLIGQKLAELALHRWITCGLEAEQRQFERVADDLASLDIAPTAEMVGLVQMLESMDDEDWDDAVGFEPKIDREFSRGFRYPFT